MEVVFSGKGGISSECCYACSKNCGKIFAVHGVFSDENGAVIGMGYQPIICDKYVQTHELNSEELSKVIQNKIPKYKFLLSKAQIINQEPDENS